MRNIAALVCFICVFASGFAEEKNRLDQKTLEMILQDFIAESPYLAKPIGLGNKGFKIKMGAALTPTDAQLARLAPLKKIGELAQITDITLKEHSLIFEVDHGFKKKGHRLKFSANMGGIPVAGKNDSTQPMGTTIELVLDGIELPVERLALKAFLKDMLHPVLDFDAKSHAQAYADTLPPLLKKIIMEDHVVCVGMDQAMVIAAKDRPKEHQTEPDSAYTDWIYDYPRVAGGAIIVRFVKGRVTLIEYLAPGKPIDSDNKPCPAVEEYYAR